MSAINFSGISNKSFLGQLLRFPLRFIPSSMKIPILQGKLRGKQWIVRSSQQCCQFLASLGYQLQSISGESLEQTDEIFAYYKT